MMELTQTHLRYLLAIYDLAQTTPGVSAGDVSKVLAVSKPSVTRMMGLLMERGLLVRERYGKVFLTDAGVLAARDYQGRMERLRELIPKMGLSLSEESASWARRMFRSSSARVKLRAKARRVLSS